MFVAFYQLEFVNLLISTRFDKCNDQIWFKKKGKIKNDLFDHLNSHSIHNNFSVVKIYLLVSINRKIKIAMP